MVSKRRFSHCPHCGVITLSVRHSKRVFKCDKCRRCWIVKDWAVWVGEEYVLEEP